MAHVPVTGLPQSASGSQIGSFFDCILATAYVVCRIDTSEHRHLRQVRAGLSIHNAVEMRTSEILRYQDKIINVCVEIFRLSSSLDMAGLHPGTDSQPSACTAEEPDIAVFRFTLGIPGFDDADIPRILGLLALAILAVNKLLSEAPSDSTQVTCTSAVGAIHISVL